MIKLLQIIKPYICMTLCIVVIIAFVCMSLKGEKSTAAQEEGLLTVWQIDSFEGGKGSRADFLQQIGNKFTESSGCYVSVISLSADAARMNLSSGNVPDLISYGAGMYGIEDYVSGYTSWCYGGYCILTLEASSDFTDVNIKNTVINEGKDNYIEIAALFCELGGAAYEKSTTAYVKLINGDYKYLLGTQRDIFRLKTRGVEFCVKPVTQFNDLYQNISLVVSTTQKKFAQEYVEYLLSCADGVEKLGMLNDALKYEDEMRVMTGLNYEYKLTSPISEGVKNQLESFIAGNQINMIKNLLK